MFILAIKIFFARIIDVSLNTIRTMNIVKGNKILASVIAFFEILVWYYAVRASINTNESTSLIAICYALGYATGTFIGSTINEHFFTGIYEVNVVSKKLSKKDLNVLRKNDFNAYSISFDNEKTILNLTISKKRYKKFLKIIKDIDNNSLIILNDAKIAYNGTNN